MTDPDAVTPSHFFGRFLAKVSWAEYKRLLQMSIPVILSYMLQNSLQTVSILIVGRLGAQELATSAFSYMFAMSTGWLIQLGGTTSIDTLGSATYTASDDPTELGVLLQRGCFVLGTLYIPVVGLWLYAEPVLRALGQSPELSASSASFLQCLIPGGLGFIYFEALKKFLQVQGLMQAGTYVLLVTSPLNGILNYLFIHPFGFGLNGAAMATGLTYWLSFIGLVIYTKYSRGSRAWGGFSRRAFTNLGIYYRLSILGIIMVGTEWWAFEIVALVAGRLGDIALAAQSCVMTSDQVTFTIPFGIGVAASTRVGNLLGERRGRAARRAAYTAALLAASIGAGIMVVMLLMRSYYGKLFSDDLDVIRETAEVIPYVAVFQIADGINASCSGSLRGMGRQHIGAFINSAAYYVLALPLGIFLAFHGKGLPGLWMGQCIALYIAGSLEFTVVMRTNWQVEVEKALARLDEMPEEDLERNLEDSETVSETAATTDEQRQA
ncbi:mate-domain-containing protein [Lipomyces tetrasporus]|uniref:Mate-domain-containing protein n=1 Tax=Lipomyces tetrasporus TaxID=54092 RepID=A0AAD7QMC8_9ASCO|nr:mate-domain-containing protein [Lipomyces tetrasporus]KAJ8097909.1 mate-domain-containing protein [Lipomyces tetrasporus]